MTQKSLVNLMNIMILQNVIRIIPIMDVNFVLQTVVLVKEERVALD